MKTTNILLILVLFTMQLSGQKQSSFKWPDGKTSAVVMSYDDALDCHLDIAIPALDRFGFKGTFYCTGNSPTLNIRMDEWRAAADNGHELGNHSLFHPCDGERFDWVKPYHDYQLYDLDRIRNELLAANTLLKAIDGKEQRSYGYTCSDFEVAGGVSFIPIVRDLFPAARNDGPVPASMDELDLHFVPSWGCSDPTGQELIDHVKKAQENGTVAVFMFHSVGGGYLNVSSEAHEELLQYLKENEADIWVNNFISVMSYVKAEQEK